MLVELPVPVLDGPHWRVNYRPEAYAEESIPSLSQCFEIVEKNKVALRGWDYPHVSHRSNERGQGSNWVASWSSYMGHLEYWRLYQSTQFIYYSSVRETTEERWYDTLRKQAASHLSDVKNVDLDKVPGFISIINFLYSVTEVVEFAARLCQAQVYEGRLDISIHLNSIKGFMLTTDMNRAWNLYCVAGVDKLGKTWQIDSESLIADSPDLSLKITIWFFERFGWMNPSIDAIRKDIDDYLSGRR